ncbi:unnamed protein product, partial [Scytosiphon promiscuus]
MARAKTTHRTASPSSLQRQGFFGARSSFLSGAKVRGILLNSRLSAGEERNTAVWRYTGAQVQISTMADRDDAVQGVRETARLGASTVIESVAEGIIEIGASTPVVAPLCKALLKAKGVVDAASRNKEELEVLEELEKLYGWCELIAVQLIDKA